MRKLIDRIPPYLNRATAPTQAPRRSREGGRHPRGDRARDRLALPDRAPLLRRKPGLPPGGKLRHHLVVRAVGEGYHLHQATNLLSMSLSYYDGMMDLTTEFGLVPGQQLQVLALPGRIELDPSQSPAALRGCLEGENTFQREPDRL